MRIGIIGANGFIGNHLLRKLVNENRECAAFIKPGSSTKAIDDLIGKYERIEGDVLDSDSLDAFLRRCDVVFNLSGFHGHWSKNKDVYFKENITGPLNVARRCLDHGIDRLVHVSSCITLGASREPITRDEETTFNLGNIDFPYAKTKRAAELEIRRIARQDGLPAVVVNPAAAIGDLDWDPSPVGRPIASICRGFWPVYVPGGSCFIDVQDLTRALWLALERGRVGEQYLIVGENMTNRRFMTKVARAAGVAAPRLKLPKRLLEAFAHCDEWVADHITLRPPRITRGMSALVGRFLYFDGTKAEQELGFKANSCEPAILRSVHWHKKRLGVAHAA